MSDKSKIVSNNNDEPKKLKNFKDIENPADFKLDEVELIKGDTPDNIDEKCLKLCKDYLSGNWCQQTVQTVTVKRITGGLINQIYHCAINKPDQSATVPQEVAVRFYGTNSFVEQDNNLRDILTSLIFSENKIGPKIYGVFEGGLIQKYYLHRQFKTEEHSNKVIVGKVFKTLARIHSLDVPIKKFPAYFEDKMDEYYELAHKNFPYEKDLTENKCETLKKTDLKAEIKWIRKALENANSPIVFTHKDYRSSNLMITEPNDDLVVCDFDISSYGNRGMDFVALARELCGDLLEMKVCTEFPLKDSILKPLIEIYVNECERIYGNSYKKNEINSVENILKEIKTYYLFSLFFWTLLMIKNDMSNPGDFPMNRKLCLGMAELSIQSYLFVKQYLIKNKIINI